MGLINAQFSDDVFFIQWQFLSEKPGVHCTVTVCLAYLYHSLASSIPCSVAITRLMNLLISGRVPIGLGSKATPSLVVTSAFVARQHSYHLALWSSLVRANTTTFGNVAMTHYTTGESPSVNRFF
jgi:hypothetical protein